MVFKTILGSQYRPLNQIPSHKSVSPIVSDCVLHMAPLLARQSHFPSFNDSYLVIIPRPKNQHWIGCIHAIRPLGGENY